MKRKLPVLLSLLSALMALACAAAWLRSVNHDDVWLFAPRNESGWWMHRIVGSADGRVVVISRREYFPDPMFTVTAGYQTPPVPASMLDRSAFARSAGGGATEFELPLGIATWSSTRQMSYLMVAWPAFVLIFAAVPSLRWWLRWVRSRNRTPAFPVLPPAA